MIVDLTESHRITEKTVVIISDVHGHLEQLNDVLEQVAFHNAQIVFVGDYIDRGPKGVEVMKLIRDMEYRPKDWGFSKVTPLKGNHEDRAVRAVDGTLTDFKLWINGGGRMEEFNALKNDFRLWMATLPLYYEHPRKIHYRGEKKKLLVTHGSIDPSVPLTHQDPEIVLNGRTVRGWDSQTLLVNGHTVCFAGQPEVHSTSSGPVIRIETGVAYGGELCGLLLEECE